MKEKFVGFCKRAWAEIGNRQTLLIFAGTIVVVCSPMWICYLLYYFFGLEKCFSIASACFAFWSGPFTPLLPICLGITLSVKKSGVGKKEGHRKNRYQENSENVPKNEKITYDKLFWLFIFGSILGVLIEGVFCLITRGYWENHVVSVMGAFNILYGFGAVLFYVGAVLLQNKNIFVRTLIMTVTATALELLSGLLLRYGLGMRAWNYENSFMNYKGLICFGFSLLWAAAAFAFCVLYPRINSWLNRFEKRGWHIACVVFSLFMAFNLCITGASIVRWSERHYGIEAQTRFDCDLDSEMPDEWMQARFMDWQFLA